MTPPLAPARPDNRAATRAVALLRAGVPLTLLIDVFSPDGPHSRELYAREQPL